MSTIGINKQMRRKTMEGVLLVMQHNIAFLLNSKDMAAELVSRLHALELINNVVYIATQHL